jgi:hypothetical protein
VTTIGLEYAGIEHEITLSASLNGAAIAIAFGMKPRINFNTKGTAPNGSDSVELLPNARYFLKVRNRSEAGADTCPLGTEAPSNQYRLYW